MKIQLAVFLFLSLILPSKNANAQIRYEFAVDNQKRYMEVRGAYPASPLRKVSFRIGSDNTDKRDFKDNIESVVAQTITGNNLKVSHPTDREWIVHNDGASFEIKYKVRSTKKTHEGDNEGFHPTIFPKMAMLLGGTYLLRHPKDKFPDIPIFAKVDAPGYPSIVASWNPNTPLDSIEDLAQSIIIAGDLQEHRFSIFESSITVVVQGNQWKFKPKRFLSAVEKVIKAQERYMGFYPAPKMLMAVTENDPGSTWGTKNTDAFVLLTDPVKEFFSEAGGSFATFSHEHFHIWNPGYARFKKDLPEGHTKWMNEGFTEYYGYLTLFREGFISAGSFVKQINKWILKYSRNPSALTATITDMEKKLYWGDRRFEKLAYDKGALIALIFDLEIRRQTGDKKNIDNFMRLLMQHFPPSKEGYDNKEIQKVIEEVTGGSWQAFFKDFIKDAKELPLRKVFLSAGFKTKSKELQSFELGFEVNTPIIELQSKVSEVLPGSNAEAAGLSVGDIIDGLDISDGNPNKAARMRVIREGKTQTISFFPARSLGKSVIQVEVDSQSVNVIEQLKISI